MGAIKAVVIGMGLLILVGFAVVAITLVNRMQDISAPAAAYKTQLLVPKGAKVVDSAVGAGTVLLRLQNSDGAEHLLVIDAATGLERGRVDLAQEP